MANVLTEFFGVSQQTIGILIKNRHSVFLVFVDDGAPNTEFTERKNAVLNIRQFVSTVVERDVLPFG